MPSLLLVVFVLQVIIHLVNTVGAPVINEFVSDLSGPPDCWLAFQQLMWIIAVDALEQASILLYLLGRSIADETSQRARWA